MGNNKIMVLLHGWGGSSSSWKNNVPYFEKLGYQCQALKIPGFDLPEPPATWGIPEYADFVISEIHKKYGNTKVVLVGHSFGGRIAIYITAQNTNLVQQLVLTSSAGINLEPSSLRKLLLIVSKTFARIEKLLPNMSSFRRVVVKLIGSKGYRKANPIMRQVFKAVVNLDLRDQLPEIQVPTLIVWGSDDKVTPMTMANFFAVKIPNAKLEVISKAGHHCHSNHANEWNKIVSKFLE